ncbi:hypothetical protein KEM54_000015 [Ascosphaera aggregata]|nr:hypothetical protein KEM54_000015 [Ascosphaera aggregata]
MSPKLIPSRPLDAQFFAKYQQDLLRIEHEAEVASSSLVSLAGSSTGSVSAATRRLLQAAGHALTGLVLVNARTGMGGREVGEFSGDTAVTPTSGSGSRTKGKGKGKEKGKSGNSSPPGGGDVVVLGRHGIRVGDVVRVQDITSSSRGGKSKAKDSKDAKDKARGEGGIALKGVVTRVGERSIWIAFGQSGGNAAPDDSQSISDFYGKKLWLLKLANDVTYRRMNQTMSRLNLLPPSSRTHLQDVLLGQEAPARPDADLSSIDKITFKDPTLNDSQKEAIRFALASKDIALIHGPPGTGKTYTIIELILQLLLRDQKVLVCGPSNISVDNIVERLAAKKVPVIRLGHPARLLDSVVSHSLEAFTQTSEAGEIVKDVRKEIDDKFKSIRKTKTYSEKRQIYADIKDLRKEYRERENKCTADLIQGSPVIAATLHGAGGSQLKGPGAQDFDVVIIDEATQALEAQCWVPLMGLGDTPKKLVLAGDHLQLPPTIISRDENRIKRLTSRKTTHRKDGKEKSEMRKFEEDEINLETTLFDRLLALHGKRIRRMLTTQYRMNEQIMKFPSEELYDNELIAADSVKDRVLTDITYSDLTSGMSHLGIDDDADDIDGKVRETDDTIHPLIFYDTQGGDFPEDEDTALSDSDSKLKALLSSDSKANTYEAAIAKSHILSLIGAGVKACDIAVIAPYNAQVSALAAILRDDEVTAGVEIGSVDGFQGREKEAVVVTLVRSNEKGEVGFLGEKRRLNVAMTRPKRQLCVIGDSETIQK